MTVYIYRGEELMEDDWTPITGPSYHRGPVEREIIERWAEATDGLQPIALRIVRAPLGAFEVEPHRDNCVVEGCLHTADRGHSYCPKHEMVWGRQ